jgi:uncharacterized protein YlxP (DUF503 family)
MSAHLTVGVLRVVLHLPESGSLKSKRQVVSGLLRKIRQELKVAAAEVGELDRWQLAELGITCVSGEARHADEMLAKALSFVERHADGAQITDVKTELVRL